jgi:hypothetical protein
MAKLGSRFVKFLHFDVGSFGGFGSGWSRGIYDRSQGFPSVWKWDNLSLRIVGSAVQVIAGERIT